jgi:hypothetical protein
VEGVAGLLLAVVTSACTDSGLRGDVSSQFECAEKVGTEPPGSVRFVGETEQRVPFDSWSCPGYSADNFHDASDYSVRSRAGSVELFFAEHLVTDLSVTGRNADGPAVETVVEVEVIGAGHVRILVPDAAATWVIRVRLATSDGRIAYYSALLQP